MSCSYHPEREANTTCSQCGKWLCNECNVNIHGQSVCKDCAPAIAGSQNNMYGAPPMGEHTSAPRYYAPRPRKLNAFFTFCCSMVPGVGYMYLGLIKRGIMLLSIFLLTFYVSVAFGSVVAGLSLCVIFCATFFDTFRLRRLINNGVHVEDDFEDFTCLIKRYWVFIALLFGLDLFRGIVQRLFWSFGLYGPLFRKVNSLFGLAIAVIGVYFVYRALCSKKSTSSYGEHEDVNKDYYNR